LPEGERALRRFLPTKAHLGQVNECSKVSLKERTWPSTGRKGTSQLKKSDKRKRQISMECRRGTRTLGYNLLRRTVDKGSR